MLDGCIEWQSDGLQVPDIVRNATDEYFDEQDTLGLWLEAWTNRNASAFTADGEAVRDLEALVREGQPLRRHRAGLLGRPTTTASNAINSVDNVAL